MEEITLKKATDHMMAFWYFEKEAYSMIIDIEYLEFWSERTKELYYELLKCNVGDQYVLDTAKAIKRIDEVIDSWIEAKLTGDETKIKKFYNEEG